jgi:NADH:flavin oxidoreductase / NADH oxidase family
VSEQSPAYRHIWTPLRIGSIRVKNRIVMTAMTSNYAEDHILSERHIAFYRLNEPVASFGHRRVPLLKP